MAVDKMEFHPWCEKYFCLTLKSMLIRIMYASKMRMQAKKTGRYYRKTVIKKYPCKMLASRISMQDSDFKNIHIRWQVQEYLRKMASSRIST
jgi:homoserine acetyltransferase